MNLKIRPEKKPDKRLKVSQVLQKKMIKRKNYILSTISIISNESKP